MKEINSLYPLFRVTTITVHIGTFYESLLESEASLPSCTNGTIFLLSWRAGVSQPSRTTGTIFLYIYISNFRAHGHRGYPLFADTLHTCSIHIRNVKYKGQQLFCRDISSCFKRFLSKLTARYSDTTHVVRWQVTRRESAPL